MNGPPNARDDADVCGICGIVNASGDARPLPTVVDRMTADLQRRGPDDAGRWDAPEGSGQASLGFRRLAIIDPTPAGSQPMWSRDGDAVLVFNGEIYNHRAIGRELEQLGARFRSTSDTEVLLEGLLRWGPDLLPRLRGMFALAFHVPADRSLLLARDHAGIKPLFTAGEPGGSGTAFSSRYDSLFRTGWLDIDDWEPDAFAGLLKLRRAAAGALHRGARQVEPGEYVMVDGDGRTTSHRWWELQPPERPYLTGEEAIEATDAAISASVRRHLISDVPVGVFLSGGVDSPLVAGAATKTAERRYPAFTVGFPGWSLDESEAAATMAGPLDLDHHIRPVSAPPGDVVDRVVEAQDEPTNDWSIIPTLLVSEHARSQVTVALSGDGGDELFFGYLRSWSLVHDHRLWGAPLALRRAIVAARRRLGRTPWGAIAHADPATYYDRIQASADRSILDRIAPDLVGRWPIDHGAPLEHTRRGLADLSRSREFTVQLPRVLRKVDQASMHHSLEVRVPLLDIDVIETSLQIDPSWTLMQSSTKPVLRALLERRLGRPAPSPKLGFGAPIGTWMIGPLRERIDAALDGAALPSTHLDAGAVRDLWHRQLSGTADHRTVLWGLAVLSWWYERVRTW